MAKVRVCILRTDGTNCDEELFYAFERYGGLPEYVHINQLRNKSKKLKNFQILAFPGGFSYGDDIASGKILAVELISFLKDEITGYINKGGLIIGICNGFQTLVRTGLLPFNQLGKMSVTMAQNESGHFECRWIKLKFEKSKCIFLNNNSGQVGDFAINSGEGRFFSTPDVIRKVEDQNHVILRYVDEMDRPTQNYPINPNGSLHAIAGVCDPTGRIIGMQPHPEKFVDFTQHPNWRRVKYSKGALALQNFNDGGYIFENMVKFAKSS